MSWWKQVKSALSLKDIIDNFDPYQIEAERVLVNKRLNQKEENNKENKNDPMEEHR